MRVPIPIALLSLAAPTAGSVVSQHAGKSHSADYNNLTVAIVRAPPANWPLPVMNKNWTGVEFDLNKTVTKAVGLIHEAAENGANLVVFPELWFPGYPKGMADKASIASHAESYINNSLVIDSPEWNDLKKAAKNSKVYIAPAFSHHTNGTIYMGQALISPEGEVLHLRHKLRPSGGEREIWSDGTVEGLKVIATPYGRWGLLECWEHFHPAMTFNMQSQVETLHIAAWPYMPEEGDKSAEYWEAIEVNGAAARTYAVNAASPLVMAAVGNAKFFSSQGLDLTQSNASASTEDVPLIYSSFNTTGLSKTAPYDPNAEQSWGILEQIHQSFPSYIPKIAGDFVLRVYNPISSLVQAAKE
ncbi:hypothetical protein N7452_003837 [Penicillium brevicompactum]|uniref:nitrilase n=1 Tax=Penicillium brevicompactum TaxID=5074 RepID=A0A9W9UL47_PENBR|nr:hypothetical protein N7452_003837 [Penicillium brevicompactum]